MTPPQEWIAFYRDAAAERIVGMWSLCDRNEVAAMDATSPDGTATLVYPDGHTELIVAIGGHYTIDLPAATNRNPFGSEGTNAIFPIGGSPVILIEKEDRSLPALPYRAFLPSSLGGSALSN